MSSEASNPHGGRLTQVRVPGVAPFRLVTHEKPDHFISKEIVRNGIWEPMETSVVVERLRPGDVLVDLGANIGYYTVVASLACGEKGRVWAFEPEPENYRLLIENVALNGLRNVEAVNAAAGRESGTAELFLSDINQGDHRLYRNDGRVDSVVVRTHSLDDWFANRDARVDLIKMDTQGVEAQIVEGMLGVLEQNRGRVSLIVEFWPFGLRGAGDSPERLASLLGPFDFRVRRIDEDSRSLVPTDWPTLLEEARALYHPDTQRFTNLLLTPVDAT